MPKISIIIPCYNQGDYIQDAIDAVEAQTFTNWEMIIVDDGSTEASTIKKLSALKQNGYNVITTNNSGVSAARNIGLNVAKGDYILPLDADDKIAPKYVNDAIEVLEKNDFINVVYCNCQYFEGTSGLSKVPEFSMKAMLFQNLIFNAAIFRKSISDSINGYDTAFKIGWEDWDFWLRYIKKENEVHKLDNTYFFYRIKTNSRNANLQDENRILCEQQIFRKHIDKYITLFEKPITYIQTFDFYKSEYNNLENYRVQLHQSISYRLGHLLLKPFKIAKRFFK